VFVYPQRIAVMDLTRKSLTYFASGTLVTMCDGAMMPVQRLRPGDSILSHTAQKTLVLSTKTVRTSGTILSVKVLGPYQKLRTNTFQRFAHYPNVLHDNHLEQYFVNWTPAGELSEGNHVLLPWIAANRTKFFDDYLQPITPGSDIKMPAVTVKACAFGLLCPVVDITAHELTNEKFYMVALSGEGTLIANGIATQASETF